MKIGSYKESRRTMAKKVFVGSLPWATTSEDLKQLFSQAGAVMSATVMVDKMTGRSRGFGFVEFETDDAGDQAVTMFNGKDFNGRALVVNEARPMTPRTGGFDGGDR